MRTIEFRGVSVEYDERCVMSYRWQKAMNSGDPERSGKAIERLYAGKDEYIAYALSADKPMSYEDWLNDDGDWLDESMDAMADLLAVVIDDMGQAAKN